MNGDNLSALNSTGDAMSDHGNQTAPTRVRNAVSLLWLSLITSLVVLMFDSSATMKSVPPAMLYTIVAITTFIMVLLIYKIGQGRNWARITLLVLFLFGLISYVSALTDLFDRSVVGGALSSAQTIMQMVALYFVFSKPGSLWFSKGESQTAG
jgi:hypothetical protein